MTQITLLLADDHAMVRAGLRLLLEAEPDLTVVAEAADGDEAIAEALRLSPDIVLLDVMMPKTSGLEAARRIRRETSCRIVMLSMQDDPGYVRQAFESGASGYVLKEVAHSQLIAAVRQVAAGAQPIDPVIAAPLGTRQRRQPVEGGDVLTRLEQDVLLLLALGHTNTEVAERLAISVRRSESHRANVMHKLGLTTRAELVRFALATGRLNAPAAIGC